jgi:putative peptidoglycan lipid II flippase
LPVSEVPKDSPNATASVAKFGGIMMGAMLLSRVLGLVRETVITSQFGFTVNTDALSIALAIPDMIFMLIAGGGLSSAFIPVFSEFLHTDREKDAWNLFSVVVSVCSVVAVLLIAAAWIYARPIVNWFAIGHSFNNVQVLVPKATMLSRVLLPAQFAFLIGSLLIATLYSRNRFAVPGLAPNVYNVGLIIGALVGPAIGLGVAGVVWGAMIGAMIGNLVMPAAVMMRLGGHFHISFNLKTPGVDKFFKLLGPIVFGFSLPSVTLILSQKFASPYGEGANYIIRASNNLIQAPAAIFGQALALGAFPALTQFFAQKRMDRYRLQLNKTFRQVIYLTAPASVLIWVLAPIIVELIYGWGKGRSAEDLAQLSDCLRAYTFGLIAWSLQPVLMRGFFSMHKTLKPILLSTAVTAFFIGMLWWIRPGGSDPMPFPSIAWATDIAFVVLIFLLYGSLQKDVGKLDASGSWITLAKSLAGAAVMGAVAYVLTMPLALHRSRLLLALAFVLIFLIASWVYVWLTRWMKMPEIEYVERAMARLSARKGGHSTDTPL